MKTAVLDTSFILTAVRQKIDFFDELETLGLRILIPRGVIKEIKSLSELSKNNSTSDNAKLALKILGKEEFETIKLEGKNVDKAIINLAKSDSSFVVATLDKEIKNKIKNSKLVIRQQKRLEII